MKNLFNFKSYFKFLSRNKLYTVIDVFGLSISLMFVILIATYTIQELSTDSFQKKADRIYVLGNEEEHFGPFRLAYRIQERYPEVEKVCPVTTWEHAPVLIKEENFNADLLFVDSTFFDLFSFQLLQGNQKNVLISKGNAVISETFARKAFHSSDPLGQMIRVNDSVLVTVSGVMKDIKNSTIPTSDILVRIDNIKYFNSSMDSERFSNFGSCILFLLAKEGADIQTKTGDMLSFFKEIAWIYKNGVLNKVVLTPLKDIYFSDMPALFLQQGDKKLVSILLSVGLLILIFAIINYINLTVAQTGFRAKEMATRRLLGSSRSDLFGKLILESMLLCFLSFGIGLFMAYLCAPFAGNLLAKQIYLNDFITPVSVGITLCLIFLIGFISGLLPAIIISRTKPIEVVRGGFRTKTKMVFSKFFIVFQNIITIALVAASLIMVSQVRHLIKAPLGYNTTNLMDISIEIEKSQVKTLSNELRQLASVKRIAPCAGTPFTRGNNNTVTYEDRVISFQTIVTDSVGFDMLGIKKLRENHLSSDRLWYLSEQALRELGIKEDAPSFKFYKEEIPIAGVIRDFKLRNIAESQSPVIFQIHKTEDVPTWNLLVEVQGDPYVAYDEIKSVYERLTRLEFTGKYIDQQIQESFEVQRKTSTIVSLFAGIALLLSLLGLLAISTYFIQQRRREIGVRKVFGSTNAQILKRLVFTFLNYVVIAFVIATPLVWYLMRKWLSDYDYRIDLSPLFFIASGGICLVISFVTVFWQSWRAANSNPVNSVKTE
ncbi:FtsX-like permease family protein [Parabacteroides sp. Marseille-P3160]|uniref:ABC transporter permease n=1 Tax=Parabacteroides sp. Marseille-P3160 TaxID=1917887 RepID=UPI0009BC7248|nr:FtsX-like permease family protein [Parabacteroides sp. Marseille-P3160]